MEAGAERLRGGLREHASLLANLGYAALVALTAGPGGHLALAVGLLSFWHYYFYALAYCLGAVRLQAFKRDAIVMKGLALLLPGWLYLSAPLDALSLAVVAAGFLLNIAAARALGSDRTYYGVEVSALPPQRVTAFPYSWTSHPMLLGNIAAYAGTLLNAPFREHWWPLALAHVAFNLGLLVMETSVRPRHGGRRAAVGSPTARGQFGPIHLGLGAALTGGLIGAALGTWGNHAGGTALGATLGAATLIHAFVIFRCYSAPTIAPDDCARRLQHRHRTGFTMSDALPLDKLAAEPGRRPQAARRFAATVGRYDELAARRTIDKLVKWVENEYREDLRRRPSKHVYVSKLPSQVIAQVDSLRNHAVVLEAIRRQFPAGSVITPMQHTDELYISHYNKDRGGDQGLYSKHYDGNLRFLRFGAVVRALIYLQSDATYKVVFGDSQVEKAFVTYEFGLLDFHRELHWVEGEYNPDDQQRILLKCNYMIAPPQGGWLARAVLGINTGVFYVVKAAMEYSKSPRNPVQYVVGLFCNLFRLMNNLHPLVPIGFILLALGAAGWGIARLV